MSVLTAKDIMTRNPIMVRSNQPIVEVLAIFKNKNINGAPVQDELGNLCGVVSLKDIAFDALWRGPGGQQSEQVGYRVASKSSGEPMTLPEVLQINADLRVSEIMTPMVFTVPIDAPLTQIAEDMSKGRVHRLVVLDGDLVVGIVTTLDLLKFWRASS